MKCRVHGMKCGNVGFNCTNSGIFKMAVPFMVTIINNSVNMVI